MSRPIRALALGAGLVIVALTGAAFWLSYAHLAEVALGHGLGSAPVRAWAWPMTLDLFIVAGELMMLRAALLRRVDLWAVGLTVAGSGGSIALNVAGVGSHADPLNYVVAAVPPTAALLAFGALMRQVHQALAGHVASAAEPAAVELPEPVAAAVTVERADDDQLPAAMEPSEVVMPPVAELEFRPLVWPPQMADEVTAKVTSAVPAETARQMVTETVTVTPAELRRQARALNREAVKSNGRPVTIKTLQDELGLSRREATELRREVVEGARS
ncbi:DUF2637 domain-containing protein [Streptomyces sp. NPDC005096]|uniref:DUF2637 domain-containing protein n=1 Tax=Streptomyces sp. NPDC005096 TaxID=3154559 RepID=UPI0033AB3DDD